MTKLHLTIVSQERQLFDADVDSVSVPTVEGELTILPGHIALFAPLQTGEIVYRDAQKQESVVVSKGFVDVAPDSHVTVMVDSAVLARDISEQAAQAARDQANAIIITSKDRQELLMAEASLRRALLELRVAQKTKRTTL